MSILIWSLAILAVSFGVSVAVGVMIRNANPWPDEIPPAKGFADRGWPDQRQD